MTFRAAGIKSNAPGGTLPTVALARLSETSLIRPSRRISHRPTRRVLRRRTIFPGLLRVAIRESEEVQASIADPCIASEKAICCSRGPASPSFSEEGFPTAIRSSPMRLATLAALSPSIIPAPPRPDCESAWHRPLQMEAPCKPSACSSSRPASNSSTEYEDAGLRRTVSRGSK